MSANQRQPTSSVIAYWIGSTIIVVLLIVVIVLGGGIISDSGLVFHRAFAVLFVGLGIVMVAISVMSPRSIFRRFLHYGNATGEVETSSFIAESMGMGFIVGGVVYGVTGSAWFLVAVF